MITQSFHLKNEERLIELQDFVKQNMPTARFKNITINQAKGSVYLAISYEIDDINKLNHLHEKWHRIDNPKPRKVGLINNIFRLLKIHPTTNQPPQ